ncbi:hypothetical protein [Gelidibacter gilvus]|uniref:YtkA-like domain-containing protein n=1 Tax=Gelidibacter gilvus TaxID=59602 RepID=A0A4Q0XG86_9FLAO|nr:hypothetical protein [Gelidibacter gilvus]RXJ50086.1 hypothetical protein ESZ48_08835 [Gelidibacter gilvus]
MKLKYIIPILFIALFTMSCSTDDDSDIILNEVEGLKKIQDLTNTTHTVELYNSSGKFETGYNAITIRIKDNASNNYIENASLSWMPVMQMPSMKHSSPKSEITKSLGKKTLFEGFIIYQMANLDGSGWSLKVDYTINGTSYTANADIKVMQAEYQNVASFMGTDEVRYVVAMMAPNNPKIGINKLKVGLFKMESMMAFPVVEDYKMTLDPRMPGMGNHGSPNNTDLIYNGADKTYEGNLSLTMTGYWVLNLKLLNASGEALKGESVTEEHPKSSLYLELEF